MMTKPINGFYMEYLLSPRQAQTDKHGKLRLTLLGAFFVILSLSKGSNGSKEASAGSRISREKTFQISCGKRTATRQ